MGYCLYVLQLHHDLNGITKLTTLHGITGHEEDI